MAQINDILRSRKAIDITEFFVENQSAELYQLEVSKRLKISRNTALKWLGVLTRNGILNARKSGKMIYFKLNTDNVVVKQMKILLSVSKLSDVLKAAKGVEGVEVYLYGSVARGEDDMKSDIDLLFVGKIEKKELIGIVERARGAMKRDVRPLVLTPLDYANLSRKDKVFYENIEKNKVRLL